MFELSDQIVEQILFAMEDQENASVVDIETGEVLPAQEERNSFPRHPGIPERDFA